MRMFYQASQDKHQKRQKKGFFDWTYIRIQKSITEKKRTKTFQ